MLRIFALLLLCLPLTVGAKTVYKYYDADGNVVFTDTPVPGAEKIVLPDPQTYSSPAPRRVNSLPEMPDTPAGDLSPYSQFKIRSPSPDQTFRNVEDVLVTLSIMPRLRAGHKVEVLLDGKAIGAPKPSPQFALQNVARGTHTVEARILDANGKQVATTGSVTFHMHRASALTGGMASTNPAGQTPAMPGINLPVVRRAPMAKMAPQAERVTTPLPTARATPIASGD